MDSYRKAVLFAVNLGEDTDTAGAITGGIAGLHYGHDEIPKERIGKIGDIGRVPDLCENFGEAIE